MDKIASTIMKKNDVICHSKELLEAVREMAADRKMIDEHGQSKI